MGIDRSIFIWNDRLIIYWLYIINFCVLNRVYFRSFSFWFIFVFGWQLFFSFSLSFLVHCVLSIVISGCFSVFFTGSFNSKHAHTQKYGLLSMDLWTCACWSRKLIDSKNLNNFLMICIHKFINIFSITFNSVSWFLFLH